MKSASLILALLLRIASGLSTENQYADDELHSSTSSSFVCHFLGGGCYGNDECFHNACSHLFEVCRKQAACDQILHKCLDVIPSCFETLHEPKYGESTPKRGFTDRDSSFLMKLHPVLNRIADPAFVNFSTRFRRISTVGYGSEFLGKRNSRNDAPLRKFDANAAVASPPSADPIKRGSLLDYLLKNNKELRRGRRLPGTELLGKKRNSEMLGKRNVELLGKRGVELLGKRGVEFLGKRGTALRIEGDGVLGTKLRSCRDGEEHRATNRIRDPNSFIRFIVNSARRGMHNDTEHDPGEYATRRRDRTDSKEMLWLVTLPEQRVNQNSIFLIRKVQLDK